jgi:hypothetical protein
MSVIARFRVNTVTPQTQQSEVALSAMYSPEEVEDDEVLKEIRSFYEFTPSGSLTMTIRNEAAEEQFQVGDEFYLRLEKIPTDQTLAAVQKRRAEEWQRKQDAKEAAGDGAS